MAPTSKRECESLAQARVNIPDDISAELDALLAYMQTRKARKGMKAAFNASPAELGRAAVSASRALAETPKWAKPIVEAALQLSPPVN